MSSPLLVPVIVTLVILGLQTLFEWLATFVKHNLLNQVEGLFSFGFSLQT